MKKNRIVLMLISICALAMIPTLVAWAYPVPPLPDDNLLVNPWFRSEENPDDAGLDQWTNELTNGIGWGISQKESNPSPDLLQSGVCGGRALTSCGTGIRWAHEMIDGVTYAYPGIDVSLFQVVETDPAHRKLNFSMYWVTHKVEVVEVLIYGSQGPNGPWNMVWRPITISQDTNPPQCCVAGQNGNPWFQTMVLDSTLETGYSYYKVLLHARYPASNVEQGDVGVKITGVYFSTELSSDPTSLSTPVVIYNPSLVPDDGVPTATPTNSGRPTQPGPSPTESQPAPTKTPGETQPSPTATPGATITATQRTRP